MWAACTLSSGFAWKWWRGPHFRLPFTVGTKSSTPTPFSSPRFLAWKRRVSVARLEHSYLDGQSNRLEPKQDAGHRPRELREWGIKELPAPPNTVVTRMRCDTKSESEKVFKTTLWHRQMWVGAGDSRYLCPADPRRWRQASMWKYLDNIRASGRRKQEHPKV